MNWKARFSLFVGCIAVSIGGFGLQKAAAAEDLRVETISVFNKLLDAPDDPVLNLRYGDLARAAGRLDQARAAYQRVLLVDPQNADAIAGLSAMETGDATPEAKTSLTVTLGGQYENNAPHRDPQFLRFDDTSVQVGVGLADDRHIAGQRITSDIQIARTAYNRWAEGSLLIVGAKSGPVFEMAEGQSLRVAPTIQYARLNTRDLFISGGLLAQYETGRDDAWKAVTAKVSYDSYWPKFKSLTGVRLRLEGLFAWAKPFGGEGALRVTPFVAHAHGVGGEGANRYNAIGAGLNYSWPLTETLIADASLKTDARRYGGHAADETTFSHRRDFMFEPEFKVTYPGLLPMDGDLTGRVNYVWNISNDQDKKYRGYLLGANAKWQF